MARQGEEPYGVPAASGGAGMQHAGGTRRSDRLHDFVRVGRALGTVFREQARNQRFVVRKTLRQSWQWRVDVLFQHLDGGLARIGPLPGQKLVIDYAEAVQIRAGVE